jgi:tRNA(Leu) C34 or U34 (ribose-2'-O)-methylase TrmL
VHPNLEQFAQVAKGRWVCFDTNGTHHLRQYAYQPGDWLLFGCESDGLPPISPANTRRFTSRWPKPPCAASTCR